MASAMHLALIALVSIRVSLGQDPIAALPTAAPILQAPADVLCPLMSPLGTGTYLEAEPWTFLRTINVMTKTELFQDAAKAAPVGTQAKATRRQLGKISTVFPALSTEYQLRDPDHDKLISKFVNPAAFWDGTQEIFSCKGDKIGSVVYNFNLLDLFKNAYREHKILDAAGNTVATLAQEEAQQHENSNIFAPRQNLVYVRDNAGTPLASMRHPSGGWQFGLWGESFEVQLESLGGSQAPPPAMDPEFITLVFANQLAMGYKLGPYWTLIVNGSIALLVVGAVLVACCGGKESKDKANKAGNHVLEETHTLLGTHETTEQKIEAKGRNIWDCCSRRGGAPVLPMQHKTVVAKAEDGAHAAASKAEEGAHAAASHAKGHGH